MIDLDGLRESIGWELNTRTESLWERLGEQVSYHSDVMESRPHHWTDWLDDILVPPAQSDHIEEKSDSSNKKISLFSEDTLREFCYLK